MISERDMDNTPLVGGLSFRMLFMGCRRPFSHFSAGGAGLAAAGAMVRQPQ
jgi:hypothetical protein